MEYFQCWKRFETSNVAMIWPLVLGVDLHGSKQQHHLCKFYSFTSHTEWNFPFSLCWTNFVLIGDCYYITIIINLVCLICLMLSIFWTRYISNITLHMNYIVKIWSVNNFTKFHWVFQLLSSIFHNYTKLLRKSSEITFQQSGKRNYFASVHAGHGCFDDHVVDLQYSEFFLRNLCCYYNFIKFMYLHEVTTFLILVPRCYWIN